MAAIDDFPVCRFLTSQSWDSARWTATTFCWHPTSEAPPIMGIVFENAEAAQNLFRELAKYYNHSDRFEELRISIIEGSLPGQRDGYSVHLCPDPESIQAHATADDVVLNSNAIPTVSRWNRMYPIPGSPPLLPRFKAEFEKHGEFLFSPGHTTPRRAELR